MRKPRFGRLVNVSSWVRSRSAGRRPCASWLASVGMAGLLAIGLAGCGGQKEIVVDTPPAAPGLTFTGPMELRGTIGSMVRLEGTEPLLVSRFGLLVNLPGTGSGFVPDTMETWLVNEMRKLGVGRRSLAVRNPEWAGITPQRILRDPRTTVVRVSGAIPPGASMDSRFDLLVEALDDDNTTTSLAGGQLWQTDLGIGGASSGLPDVRRLAIGRGPVYVPPYEAVSGSTSGDETGDEGERQRFMRRAVIVGGGVVKQPRRLEIILNQRSHNTAGIIESAINARFRVAPEERIETAIARNDLRIDLTIPRRYRANPQHLLDLIAHTYPFPVQVGPTVDDMVAWMERSAGTPEAEAVRRRATLVIKALGPVAGEHVPRHYGHADADIRLALLEVGAYLGDTTVAERLIALADAPDAATRIQVAEGLVHLSRNTRVSATLRTLLSDPELDVRLAAYETLRIHGSPLIDSLAVTDRDGTKFVIDRVPSEVPSVYISAEGTPRIVLFAPQQGFVKPMFASLWDHRMTLMSPSTIPQAAQELDEGNMAFLPVVRRGPVATLAGGVQQAEVFDALGAPAVVRASNPTAAALLAEALPDSAGGSKPYLVQGRVTRKLAGQLVVELVGVDDSLERMPLSVYYRSPWSEEPVLHRVTPTVATLAYFLAHHPTMAQPQDGLDLNFGQVVDVLYQLNATGMLPADLRLAQSGLVEELAGIEAEAAPIERPESDGTAPGRPEPAITDPGNAQRPAESRDPRQVPA